MSGLSARDVLQIWETGLSQHPVDRALTILAQAYPQIPREQLALYSIGRRDALLLDIRERTFGTRLDALDECEVCRTLLEFTLDSRRLRVTRALEPDEAVFHLSVEHHAVEYRLLNSFDLAAIAACPDLTTARDLLIRRCILKARAEREELAVEHLPENVVAELSARIAAHDTQAEIQLELLCPACEHRWHALFDIASFMWTEICARSKRLFREIDLLARNYGWSESEILGLSNARRQVYLAMVT
jgi:hypothetical protein